MPRFRSHFIPDEAMEQEGIVIPGCTLGEFIASLESRAGIRLTPEDGEKYFRLTELATGAQVIVDVHIMRHDIEICPKQDMTFALEPDDIVEAGILVC
jgi:hypothetical protein